jgi:hypothetical protein
MCGGCIYSNVWWLYIQYCVVAVYTVLCGGCIYSLCGGCVYSLYIQSILMLSSCWPGTYFEHDTLKMSLEPLQISVSGALYDSEESSHGYKLEDGTIIEPVHNLCHR